jgi:hypothetical protein
MRCTGPNILGDTEMSEKKYLDLLKSPKKINITYSLIPYIYRFPKRWIVHWENGKTKTFKNIIK